MFHRCRSAFFVFAILIVASSCFAEDKVASKDANEKTSEQPAVKKERQNRYLRIVKDEDGELQSLDTAIIRFVPEDDENDFAIDLVGAIHVAEPEYYDQLNREFDKYDAVLYELVAPKGTRPEQGSRNKNTGFIGSMQHGMTDLLDLEHQLDGINYKRDQFVHADLSPEEFAKSMRERKESVFGYAVRLFVASSAQQAAQRENGVDDMAVLAAMLSPDRAIDLKRAMAPQFVNMEMTMFLVDGPKGSTLISARNQKAIDILVDKIDQGKKKLAIFYGAGHLPDLERRMVKQLKLKRDGTRWIQAWDLRKEAEGKDEGKGGEKAE